MILFKTNIAARILIKLWKSKLEFNISKLSREIDSTYVHCRSLVINLQDDGLLDIIASGRENIIKITDRGFLVASHLFEINELLSSSKILRGRN